MNITKRFADRLFALGFRIAYWFFRRSPAKAVAQEPPAADKTNWLAASSGPISWEAALSGQAQRQQADPTIR